MINEKPTKFFLYGEIRDMLFPEMGFECECLGEYCCYGIDDNGKEMQLCKSGFNIEPELLKESAKKLAKYKEQNNIPASGRPPRIPSKKKCRKK